MRFREVLVAVMAMEGETQSTLAEKAGCRRQDVNRYMNQPDSRCSTASRILAPMGWELVACKSEDVPEGAVRVGGER